MKAITINQPWATLIAMGEKRFETRSWATKHRGPIAIHAGKKIDKMACLREPIISALVSYGYNASNLPAGAVVAQAELSNCWKVMFSLPGEIGLFQGDKLRTDLIYGSEKDFGWYEDGRYAWELSTIRSFEEPIPAKGQQGLWNWDEGTIPRPLFF